MRTLRFITGVVIVVFSGVRVGRGIILRPTMRVGHEGCSACFRCDVLVACSSRTANRRYERCIRLQAIQVHGRGREFRSQAHRFRKMTLCRLLEVLSFAAGVADYLCIRITQRIAPAKRDTLSVYMFLPVNCSTKACKLFSWRWVGGCFGYGFQAVCGWFGGAQRCVRAENWYRPKHGLNVTLQRFSQ